MNKSIGEQIKEKAEVIAEVIANGKSVEFHPCKDGVKMFIVDKKFVK